jgi:hypothetical protein
MGANAVTTVPVYTAGEVLTAADMNITNSGIPVFATTVTRDAAFGGTGEKTLAEGQFAYIEATNTTQYYDGSAWQSVGVAPGLVLITTATATAVSSLSINDCFSSTYAAYEIQIINTDSVGVNSAFKARLRVSATDTTTQYTTQRMFAYSTTVGAALDTAGTDEWYISDLDPTNKGYFAKMTLQNPNAATKTTGRISSSIIDNGGTLVLNENAVVQGATTQFTGITFITAGTSFTVTIRVYGYANS